MSEACQKTRTSLIAHGLADTRDATCALVHSAASCLPINYITFVIDAVRGGEPGGRSDVKALKILRLMRLAKLLRIARLKKLLEKYEDLFDMNRYLSMIATVFALCFTAHIMACSWYIVGQSTEVLPNGDTVYGWVHNTESAGWSTYGLETSCDTDAGCEVSYSRRYWVRICIQHNLAAGWTESANVFTSTALLAAAHLTFDWLGFT